MTAVLLEMGRLDGSANELGVEFLVPFCIVIGCYAVAGNITVCGIEGLVDEMVWFMHYTGIVHAINRYVHKL